MYAGALRRFVGPLGRELAHPQILELLPLVALEGLAANPYRNRNNFEVLEDVGELVFCDGLSCLVAIVIP